MKTKAAGLRQRIIIEVPGLYISLLLEGLDHIISIENILCILFIRSAPMELKVKIIYI